MPAVCLTGGKDIYGRNTTVGCGIIYADGDCRF